MKTGLGTQLRHLLELLDGAVSAAYTEQGLAYRPRYTPVMRALLAREPSTLGQIVEAAGMTQPAATQTVALMIKEGLVTAEAGPSDGRQRLIRLTDHGRDLLPRIQACWRATERAAASLDAALPRPLSQTLADAIAALEAKPFAVRIAEARDASEAPERHARPAQRGATPTRSRQALADTTPSRARQALADTTPSRARQALATRPTKKRRT